MSPDKELLISSLARLGDSDPGDAELERRAAAFESGLRRLREDPAEADRIAAIAAEIEAQTMLADTAAIEEIETETQRHAGTAPVGATHAGSKPPGTAARRKITSLSQVFTAQPSSIPRIRGFVRRCLAESPLTEEGTREVDETVFRALLDATGPTGSIQVTFRIFPEHVEVDVLHSETTIQASSTAGPAVLKLQVVQVA